MSPVEGVGGIAEGFGSDPSTTADADDGDNRPARKSQATELVEIGEAASLFHSPDGVGFASFKIGTHREVMPLRSKGVRSWLARRYFARHKKTPGMQAIQDAIGVLEGRAMFDSPEEPVFVRISHHGGGIVLDLGDADHRCVAIDREGWKVVGDSPVNFRRTPGMLPLPIPVAGGSIEDLAPFVNVTGEAWVLVKAFLVALFAPGPKPILVLIGPQGSAKTFAAKSIRAVFDPNIAAVRSSPRSAEDLVIAAKNSAIVVLDNVSFVSMDLSDNLCRIATGGAFGKRALYSDDDEILTQVQRPIICNGIGETLTRGDALDRAILCECPPIPDSQRRLEADLIGEYDLVLPGVLGALLDAVVVALQRVDTLGRLSVPRMADFAKWSIAAEPALGLEDGDFLRAYRSNRESAVDLAIEADLIGEYLLKALEGRDRWEGIAGELLEIVNDEAPDAARRRKGWPTNSNSMSNRLSRLEPMLNAKGWSVERERTPSARVITIARLEESPNPASSASSASSDGPSDDAHDAEIRPHSNRNPEEAPRDDAHDAHDAEIGTSSNALELDHEDDPKKAEDDARRPGPALRNVAHPSDDADDAETPSGRLDLELVEPSFPEVQDDGSQEAAAGGSFGAFATCYVEACERSTYWRDDTGAPVCAHHKAEREAS